MEAFRSFLSGIAYSLGSVTPIDELQETETISAESLAILKQRGLASFCKETRPTPDMCLSSVFETLGSVSLTPERIDAIVFANSYPDWNAENETALLTAFYQAGFGRAYIVGLTLQGCSACAAALRVASDLTKNRLIIDNALVILCGRVSDGSRLGPHATTINGDGAASCIVSSEHGQFEILASESQTNASLAGMEQSSKSLTRYVRTGFLDLCEISGRALSSSGMRSSEIRALFGTNGSLMYLDLMAEATQVPPERVYKEPLATYGHVHACDNLIGLKTYCEKSEPRRGENYMLLGWSPYVVSASIIRFVG